LDAPHRRTEGALPVPSGQASMPTGPALLPPTPTACLLGLELLGDSGWGDGWLCGFTSGGGLARDSLSNGMCHKQSTHLDGRRRRCYHIGLNLRVICIAMRIIGGACNRYGSWHDVEHGKRSRACCVEDTHPPSTEGLETISDCTTD
jgi:hypothetical protein